MGNFSFHEVIVLFIVHLFRDNTAIEGRTFCEEARMMGDVMVILGLALYVPMSVVFMLCRR